MDGVLVPGFMDDLLEIMEHFDHFDLDQGDEKEGEKIGR